MSEFDINKSVFRDDLVPESNEQCSVGTFAKRFKTGRFKQVFVDTLSVAGAIITALTDKSVPFWSASQSALVDDNVNLNYDSSTQKLTAKNLTVLTTAVLGSLTGYLKGASG